MNAIIKLQKHCDGRNLYRPRARETRNHGLVLPQVAAADAAEGLEEGRCVTNSAFLSLSQTLFFLRGQNQTFCGKVVSLSLQCGACFSSSVIIPVLGNLINPNYHMRLLSHILIM